MPLFIPRHGPRILYAHVPKTAGTSVTLYLERRFGPPLMTNRTSREAMGDVYRRRGFITPPGHFSAEDLVEFINDEVDFCFATVRDPLTRIISEYGFQMKTARHGLKFSTWLRVMLGAARREPRIYANHLRPQTDMVPDRAEVFRLEDGLERFVERLDAITGERVPYSIDELNESSVPAGSLKLHRQDIDLITRFYAVDYDRFGYARPSVDGFPSDGMSALRHAAGWGLAWGVVAKQRRDWLQ